MVREATLDQYKALEAEQRKWEAREARLVVQLNAASYDHIVDPIRDQLQAAKEQLAEAGVTIEELEEAKRRLQQQTEELTAELAFVQTKLRGFEATGGVVGEGVGRGRPSAAASPMVGDHAGLRSAVAEDVEGPVVSPVTSTRSTSTRAPTHSTSPSTAASVVSSVSSAAMSLSVLAPSFTPPLVSGFRSVPTCMSPADLGSVGPTTVPAGSGMVSATRQSPHVSPVVTTPVMFVTAAPMMNQMPPIQRFSGEDTADDDFLEWHEQFEAVAQLAGWTEHGKQVNLTTRLKGAAYLFFRSCTPQQRADYTLLVAELKRRFTPVQLTAIQTQLFHDRKQGSKETVDDYAQALRKLFKKAYAGVLRGEPERDAMGQTVLANQFISGLLTDLKSKVVGTEGNLERLLVLKKPRRESSPR